MKILITLFLGVLFVGAGFGQAKLSAVQKAKYVGIVEKLDHADAAFAADKNGQQFFDSIQKAYQSYLSQNRSLVNKDDKEQLRLTMLNYADASEAIRLGEKSRSGKSSNLTGEERAKLSQIQKRWGKLLDFNPAADVLNQNNIDKLYTSARDLKKGLHTILEN